MLKIRFEGWKRIYHVVQNRAVVVELTVTVICVKTQCELHVKQSSTNFIPESSRLILK